LKGILSEHPEQALMVINNSFQTTALTWILSLGKKLSLQLRKNRTACLGKSHPDGDLKNIALRAGFKGFKGFFALRTIGMKKKNLIKKRDEPMGGAL